MSVYASNAWVTLAYDCPETETEAVVTVDFKNLMLDDGQGGRYGQTASYRVACPNCSSIHVVEAN